MSVVDPRSTEGAASYELFLSHSHGDAPAVHALAEQLDELGIGVFLDSWEMVPGQDVGDALAHALKSSGAVAVLVGPAGMGRWHTEEARQALRRAIDASVRSFIVWLPDAPSDPPGLPEWLQGRIWVSLRDKVAADGRVTDAGLAELVAGARGMTLRAARSWLQQRRDA